MQQFPNYMVLSITLVIWLLVCYIDIPRNKVGKKLWLMFIPAIYMMATRDVSVGLDTYQYSIHFENDMVLSWRELLTTKDFLFEGLMKLSGYVIGDYYFFKFYILSHIFRYMPISLGTIVRISF